MLPRVASRKPHPWQPTTSPHPAISKHFAILPRRAALIRNTYFGFYDDAYDSVVYVG